VVEYLWVFGHVGFFSLFQSIQLRRCRKGRFMLGLVLLIVLILLLFGAVPRWNHSQNWGYGPSGLVTLLLVVVIILFFTGTFHV
jgi:hypothetical protein